jgi:DNA-binding MarR family transcriptional regulator
MKGKETHYADIEKSILEKNPETIKKIIEDELASIELLIRQSELEVIKSELDIQKNIWFQIIKQEKRKNSFEFLIGRCLGILEFLEKYIFNLEEKEKSRKLLQETNIENVPHINDIILHIAKNDGIRHGKLAEKVGIEKNTLTGIMDKLYRYDIVAFSRVGKYKHYYLTENGYNYYKDNLSNIELNMNVDSLIEQLLVTISNDATPSETFAKILRAVYEQKHLSEGYVASKKIDPVSLLPEIVSMQPFELKIPHIPNTYTVNQAMINIPCSNQNFNYKVMLFNNGNNLENNTDIKEGA